MDDSNEFVVDADAPQRSLPENIWAAIRAFLFDAPNSEEAYHRSEALEALSFLWLHELIEDEDLSDFGGEHDVIFVEHPGVGGPTYTTTSERAAADTPERYVGRDLVSSLRGWLANSPNPIAYVGVIGDIASEWRERLANDERFVGHLVIHHASGAELKSLDSEELYKIHANAGECD